MLEAAKKTKKGTREQKKLYLNLQHKSKAIKLH
jgi:hypothetical protein